MAKNKEKKEPIKDAAYYERRRQEGIRKVTASKTPFQRLRTFERMMAKLDKKKPNVDPVNGVEWGKSKEK